MARINSKKKKKKLIRRIIRGFFIFILLLIGCAFALPHFFKDEINEFVKETISNEVNANVDYKDFSVSIFSTFPDFQFTLEDFSVTGTDTFEGILLAKIKKVNLELDVWSVVSGSNYEVESVGLIEPEINIVVLDNGLANYDISKPLDSIVIESETNTPEKPSPFQLKLHDYYINDASLTYNDKSTHTFLNIRNLTHRGEGKFTDKIFTLSTNTTADAIDASARGITYLSDIKSSLKADIDINSAENKYTLAENELSLNELILSFDGFTQILENDIINTDLTFKTNQTEFKHILSLIPVVYKHNFSAVKTKGKLALNGFIKGSYSEDRYPSFNILLDVLDGYFKYPDLPNSADNINIKTVINHPGGDLDKMTIDVNKFNLDLANNPVQATFNIKNLMSDPYLNSKLVANLDLEKLATVVPLEKGDKFAGLIDAALDIEGNYSTIEKKDYTNFNALGNLKLANIHYETSTLPYNIDLKALDFEFTPKYANLKQSDIRIGKSDFNFSGKIDNYLTYAMSTLGMSKDIVELKGNFNMSSNTIDLDHLMGITVNEDNSTTISSSTSDTVSRDYGSVSIPDNLNLNLNTQINTLIYDKIQIKNVKGKVRIHDKIASLTNVDMALFGGNARVNGDYITKGKTPEIQFYYDIKDFDIEQTVQYVNSIQQLAPAAKYCKGNFSTKMKFNSLLDEQLYPVMNSITGFGKLTSNAVTVMGFGPLKKIADQLKIKELYQQTLDRLNLSFAFKNGKAIVDPYTTKLDGMNATISGYTSFDGDINYDMKIDVPQSKLGKEGAAVMDKLISAANKSNSGIKIGNIIPVKAKITGTAYNPKVKLDIKGAAKSTVTEIKEQVITKVKDTVKHFIDEGKEKLNAEVTKIMNQANAAAAEIRKNANDFADLTQQQGYAEADKLKGSGANFLEKAANNKAAELLRNQTDKKVAKLRSEGNAKAQEVIDAANRRVEAMKD